MCNIGGYMKYLASFDDVDFAKKHIIINALSIDEAKERFLAFEQLHNRNYHNLSLLNLDEVAVLTDDFNLSD